MPNRILSLSKNFLLASSLPKCRNTTGPILTVIDIKHCVAFPTAFLSFSYIPYMHHNTPANFKYWRALMAKDQRKAGFLWTPKPWFSKRSHKTHGGPCGPFLRHKKKTIFMILRCSFPFLSSLSHRSTVEFSSALHAVGCCTRRSAEADWIFQLSSVWPLTQLSRNIVQYHSWSLMGLGNKLMKLMKEEINVVAHINVKTLHGKVHFHQS